MVVVVLLLVAVVVVAGQTPEIIQKMSKSAQSVVEKLVPTGYHEARY